MEGFDSKDMRILYELERDAREPVSSIARKVRLSKPAVLYRIARLEKLGVIERYITVIDYARLGFHGYEVWVRLNMVAGKEREKLVDFLSKHPNVYWLASCTLSFDLSVGFMARSPAHLRKMWEEVLERFGGLVNSYVFSTVVELYNFGRTYLMGKGALEARAREHSFGVEREHPAISLDEDDRKLLELTALEGRVRAVALARKLGVSEKTVRKRLAGMTKSGLISGFKAHVHPTKLGYSWFEIFVSLRWKPGKGEQKLLEYCRRHPSITYYLRCVSRWDLDIAVEVRTLEEFQQIVAELRERFSDIIDSYETVGITFDHKFNYLPPLG